MRVYNMRTDTVETTIDQETVDKVISQDLEQTLVNEILERYIGTFETYGVWPSENTKPKFSNNVKQAA